MQPEKKNTLCTSCCARSVVWTNGKNTTLIYKSSFVFVHRQSQLQKLIYRRAIWCTPIVQASTPADDCTIQQQKTLTRTGLSLWLQANHDSGYQKVRMQDSNSALDGNRKQHLLAPCIQVNQSHLHTLLKSSLTTNLSGRKMSLPLFPRWESCDRGTGH